MRRFPLLITVQLAVLGLVAGCTDSSAKQKKDLKNAVAAQNAMYVAKQGAKEQAMERHLAASGQGAAAAMFASGGSGSVPGGIPSSCLSGLAVSYYQDTKGGGFHGLDVFSDHTAYAAEWTPDWIFQDGSRALTDNEWSDLHALLAAIDYSTWENSGAFVAYIGPPVPGDPGDPGVGGGASVPGNPPDPNPPMPPVLSGLYHSLTVYDDVASFLYYFWWLEGDAVPADVPALVNFLDGVFASIEKSVIPPLPPEPPTWTFWVGAYNDYSYGENHSSIDVTVEGLATAVRWDADGGEMGERQLTAEEISTLQSLVAAVDWQSFPTVYIMLMPEISMGIYHVDAVTGQYYEGWMPNGESLGPEADALKVYLDGLYSTITMTAAWGTTPGP